MNAFAHIFIGNEFLPLVQSVAEKVYLNGGAAYISCGNNTSPSLVNLYVMDGNSLHTITTEGCLTPIGIDLTDPNKTASALLNNVYNQIVRVGGNTNALKVLFHFPLYKSEALETAIAMFDGFNACRRIIECDFAGYASDMDTIIGVVKKNDERMRPQLDLFKQFKDKRQLGTRTHLLAIQNVNEQGVSLNLSQETFVQVLSAFFIVCANDYDKLIPNNNCDVIAWGLSKITLDWPLVIRYLQARISMQAIENAKAVNSQSEILQIEVSKVSPEIKKMLDSRVSMLSGFLNNIKAQKNFDGNVSGYQTELKEKLNSIIDDSIKLYDLTNDLTYNTAVLAAMLSTQSDLLTNNSYFNSDLVYDDLYSEALDFLVENDLAKTLARKMKNNSSNEDTIFNPIKVLPEVKKQLLNARAHEKNCEETLSKLEKTIKNSGNVGNCYVDNGRFHFQNYDFRLLPNVKQEPLDETYEPHAVKESSVDLRSFFSDIRNQGNQGSCLAHAITSIFEYILRRNSKTDSDLSEAFLYYNAREMDTDSENNTHSDSGSRFKPTLTSLTKYGIALERFCPYSEKSYSTRPSESAYKDAEKRKLKTAKNVAISVEAFKSALTDGYPIVCSFRLTDSFFKSQGGEIFVPTEAEISADDGKDKHNHHAMVIVGYSDDLESFVVRNSWGKDWGDKGYCYIPYKYIEKKGLCTFTCIITEIHEIDIPHLENIPVLKIDDTDLRIQYLAKKIELGKERVNIQKLDKERRTLSKYFEDLKGNIKDTQIYSQFVSSGESELASEIVKKSAEQKENEERKAECNNNFTKWTKKFLWITTLPIVVCWILVIGGRYLWNGILELNAGAPMYFGLKQAVIICTTLSICYAIVMIILYRIRWKHWKNEIQECTDNINSLSGKIKKITRQKELFRPESSITLATVIELDSVKRQLEDLYISLSSLITNLRIWHAEAKQEADNTTSYAEPPIVSLFNLDVLNQYYRTKIENDDNFNINFCKDIANHKIDQNYLQNYRESVQKEIKQKILNVQHLRSYNIASHIVEQNNTQLLCTQASQQILTDSYLLSQCFLHFSGFRRTITSYSYLFAPSLTGNDSAYRNRMNGLGLLSSFGDLQYNQDDKSTIPYEQIFLQTAALAYDECVDLYNN